jgi:hypothetical protein
MFQLSPRLFFGTARHERGKAMANRLICCISAVLVLAWAPAARAQVEDIWSAAGVTGMVDEADGNIHSFNSTGSVSIKSSVASGTLDIRFPVHTMPNHLVPEGACTEFSAVLRDTGPGVRVIVRLVELGVKSGLEGRRTVLGQIDSDTTPRGGRLNEPLEYARYRTCLDIPTVRPALAVAQGSFRPFDFQLFTYYVEAQLIKTAQGGNPGPGLMSVQICNTEEQCEP